MAAAVSNTFYHFWGVTFGTQQNNTNYDIINVYITLVLL